MTINRRALVKEIRELADSLDEHVTIDDVYTQLVHLANDVECGIWDHVKPTLTAPWSEDAVGFGDEVTHELKFD